jgi:hypothetical protein
MTRWQSVKGRQSNDEEKRLEQSQQIYRQSLKDIK